MSFKLLHEAQSKLKNIIHNRFDSAVRSGDVASVERFFKTFPLIGEHKAGLEKFSKYLCTQVIHRNGHTGGDCFLLLLLSRLASNSMILNDLECQYRGVYVFFGDFGLQHKSISFTRWTHRTIVICTSA